MKKILIVLGLGIVISILTLIGVRFYNVIAERQRESIIDCQVNSDCELKQYVNECIRGWSGCFNKNKTPMNNLGPPMALCDFPVTSCLCVKGKCTNDTRSFTKNVKEEQKAIQIVRSLSEVKDWLALFSNPDGSSPTTGGKPIIEIEKKEGKLHIIHVYELVPDDGHRATFNWYRVNLDTGEVGSDFK